MWPGVNHARTMKILSSGVHRGSKGNVAGGVVFRTVGARQSLALDQKYP